MKTTLLTAAVFCLATVLFGQTKSQPSFIIQGRILNSPDDKLLLYTEIESERLVDTIPLKPDGSFYFKTSHVKSPQQSTLANSSLQINELFVAPGYNLTLTADAGDRMTAVRTKRISGTGAESNRYQFLLDSVAFARMDTTQWWMLDSTGLLQYARSVMHLKDSVANLVFTHKAPPADAYFRYFEKKVRLDIRFEQLYFLLEYVLERNLGYDETIGFVEGHADKELMGNVYKDEYLQSEFYKYWIVANKYLSYLVKLDCLRQPPLCDDRYHMLDVISKEYKGKPKEYSLQKILSSYISGCQSLDRVAEYKQRLVPYIDALQNTHGKEELYAQMSAKEASLAAIQVGQPAPAFVLADAGDQMHNLQDFAGKVVYIDLWASWCHPCREETPAFKSLYEKYKDNKQVAFVSIAVSDNINEWKKAMAEDKPTWLQLLDKDKQVMIAYAANLIPKFVVIDKQGKIADFDAPRPSSGETIEALLNREIAKQ